MEKGKFMNFIALSFYLDAITNFWSVSRHLLFLITKEYNFLLTEKNEIQKTAVSQKSVLIFLIKFCLTLKGYNVSLFTEQLIHSALFFPLSLSEAVNVDMVWHFAQTASNHKPENRIWPLTI